MLAASLQFALSFSLLRYGELASLAGKPGAARAVGTAMSNNPVCLLVPCHRVIPACGGKLKKRFKKLLYH